ncbi:amino acid ABC transporter permease [Breznakiella homolactica]|uniref:Amino acid ABC transporter permease n=1 Tax=Breznakiella homolactica TaxID=2798577 RepID=A0A7T8BCF7_9SPIR|nr:amino acid ABC transporter permease [Breznakiella homolactica]QQO11090.1 amino acid ABC transporter permease [Breznakiella homolactica]
MFEEYLNLTAYDALFFLRAAGTTLGVTLISIAIGTVIGVVMGIIRCSKVKIISFLPLIYIEPLRNSPLITQLFLVYYGLPVISHIMFSAYTAAVITLSLNTGAFFAVLVHNSVKGIPQAQWEAGYALGHGKFSVFLHIISPQVLRLLVPMAITLYINQLQCSSFVSLISLIDLTRSGQILSLRTMKPFLIWAIVFAIYFGISYPLSRLARNIEKRVDFAY